MNVDSLGDDFRICFRIQYFGCCDSGYMFMPVHGGVWNFSQIFYVNVDTGSGSHLFGVCVA